MIVNEKDERVVMRHGVSRFVRATVPTDARAMRLRQCSILWSGSRRTRSAAKGDAARTAAARRGRTGRRWLASPSISRVESRWSCRLLVADRADACMPPLVAMPITQAPDPAPHELANGAPGEIVINIHDHAHHHGPSSARSRRFAIMAWCIPPQMSHAPHEPSWPFGVDSRAENFRVPSKDALIPRDDAQASRGFLSRQRTVGDEEIAQQNDVVVFAQNPVKRFDAPLVGNQMEAAAPLEQADVEPVILHVTPPGVKIRRLRLGPGQDHQPPRTAIALLETGRDGAEPIAANLPVLHAATLAAQRPRGDFEDAARVRLAVGAGAVAEHARAG